MNTQQIQHLVDNGYIKKDERDEVYYITPPYSIAVMSSGALAGTSVAEYCESCAVDEALKSKLLELGDVD